jgi:hypothetical protein
VEEQITVQVSGRLAVVEEDAAFFVTREADPTDWLVRFEKSPDFKAREWAENMVNVYNRRLSHPSAGPPLPPGTQPATYDP